MNKKRKADCLAVCQVFTDQPCPALMVFEGMHLLVVDGADIAALQKVKEKTGFDKEEQMEKVHFTLRISGSFL